MGIVGAKLGGKGRAGARLDLSGPGWARASSWTDYTETQPGSLQKRVLFLQGPTGTQTSSPLALQLGIFSLSPKYLLVGAL